MLSPGLIAAVNAEVFLVRVIFDDIAGLARQLERTDLPPATCRRLRAAENSLWRAVDATRSVQSSELWSWRYADGGYRIVPFGASGADADESNAAQLWSTVYLALHRPPPGTGCRSR